MDARSATDQVIEADLERLEKALTLVVGAVLQKPNRAARAIVGVAASKVVAAGVTAGVFGAIAAFGLASTGTAIGTLSGAAATTATLYWIGSIFGAGAAAGGVILASGALVVGIPAGIALRRNLFGRVRKPDDLSERARANLYAALKLASSVRVARLGKRPVDPVEMRVLAEVGLAPFLADLRRTFLATEKESPECASSKDSLALLPRRRMRSAVARIDRVNRKWKGWRKKRGGVRRWFLRLRSSA